jgi:hypothetical protein
MVEIKMNEPDENPRGYKWPWLLLAAVVLAVVLAILWVSFAAREVERERGTSPAVPAGAK